MSVVNIILHCGSRRLPLRKVASLLTTSPEWSNSSKPSLTSSLPPPPPLSPPSLRLTPHHLQVRSYSSDYFIPVPSSLLHTVETALYTLHDSFGLPWWFVIVGVSFALRVFVSFPIAVWHEKKVTKQRLLIPKLKVVQNAMLPNVINQCRLENLSYTEFQKQMKKKASCSLFCKKCFQGTCCHVCVQKQNKKTPSE